MIKILIFEDEFFMKEKYMKVSDCAWLVCEKIGSKENGQDIDGYIMNYPLKEINSLIYLLKSGEKEAIANHIDEFFNKLARSKDCTGEYIKSICVNMILICCNLLNEHNDVINDVMKGEINIYMILSKLDNLQDVIEWMTSFLLRVKSIIYEKQKPLRRKYIDDVLEFINNNYMKNISLSSVAEYVHVHPVHLGRILRRELGENFSAIVLRVRMEAAKKLMLDTRKKNCEVATSVGISDAQYFSQVFKKYTGMTTTEYKDSIGSIF
ncbi:MAG: helix-turn-helix transcriptional regulator [Clostridiaceae bacterium]|nr:helix-turn-helix transcriptional regulator [Clostridiaceae bacterium]